VTTTPSLLPVPTRTACAAPVWPVSDHCAAPVLDLLTGLGWPLVATPEADIHATSPDGRVYVGWLPEDRDAATRGILWRIQVSPIDAPSWTQEFGIDTPGEMVAAFLASLIGHPSR